VDVGNADVEDMDLKETRATNEAMDKETVSTEASIAKSTTIPPSNADADYLTILEAMMQVKLAQQE
jgi:hypothetical protein